MTRLQQLTAEIIRRYQEYQGSDRMSREDTIELYDKLIKEEHQELQEAVMSRCFVWMRDAIVDIYRVEIVYHYIEQDDIPQDHIDATHRNLSGCDSYDIFCDCLEEIVRSNFTKSKGKQKDGEKAGKIIKWPNYSAPQLEPILEKYGILSNNQ